MENIKFIKTIMSNSNIKGEIYGNCIYYNSDNANVAKVWCESDCVRVKIVNKKEGEIDNGTFPFANYFKPKQCSKNAPKWHQHIDNGDWYFSNYEHCLPTIEDFISIASAIEKYIKIFS